MKMNSMWLISVFLVENFLLGSHGLNNGLALTPPMGWMTWERFRCNLNCDAYPNECISENLIKRTADLMVSEGYLEAGYQYIIVDDCWLEKKRDTNGRLVPDKHRFPSGIKALAGYVHSKGLKFGIYQDYGTQTCAQYPGIFGHEQVDAVTLASWDVDYIKLDGCYSDPKTMDIGYPMFGEFLNETGRPIVYGCSWPYFQTMDNIAPNYTAVAENCNLWRLYTDIQDSWYSVREKMQWVVKNQDRIVDMAGPGHWNDPDMLVIGNYGLSEDQAQMHMAVWAVMAAPLIMSVDLATIKPEFKAILLNLEIIAVNQDKLGKQGRMVHESQGLQIWTRPLYGGCRAVAFVSFREDGMPYAATFTFTEMALPITVYSVKDLYSKEQKTVTLPFFTVRVNPTGVRFFKFTPRTQGRRKS